MLTITQVKDKIGAKLHGTTLSKLSGSFYDKCSEAANNVITRTDPYTTIRRARLENAIYDKVYNYTAPSDLKGISKIVDIRPIALRDNTDDIRGTYSRNFDIRKEKDTMAIEVINGTKTIKLSKELDSRTVLHELSSLTLNGTVAGSNDVENLTTNTLEYVSGTGSIQFGLSGSTGTGTITITLSNNIDLSDMEDVGALFTWLRFPDASDLTSLEMIWGDDLTTNYWSKSVTAAHDRAWEDNAWQLNRFDWVDATQTGSPDSENVAVIQFNFTYSNAQTNIFMDCISASKGEAWEMLYYSNALFRDTTGATYKTLPTADSDVLLLDNDGENMFIYEMMKIINQEVRGKSAERDYKYYDTELNKQEGLYDMFNLNYPSQAVEHQIDYYDFDELDGM